MTTKYALLPIINHPLGRPQKEIPLFRNYKSFLRCILLKFIIEDRKRLQIDN